MTSTDDPSPDRLSPKGSERSREEGTTDGKPPLSSRRARGWRSRVAWSLLLVAGTVLFLLCSAPGNQLVWSLLAPRIERAIGLHISVEHLRLGWGLRLVADNVVVVTEEGETLLRIEALEAAMPLSAVRQIPQRIAVRSLTIEGVWFDLQALPESSGEPANEPTWQLDIDEFSIRDGELADRRLGEPIGLPLGTQPIEVRSYGAEGVRWEGRLRAGRVLLVSGDLEGQLRWAAAGIEPNSAGVSTHLLVDRTTALSLQRTQIEAPGFEFGGALECPSFSLGPCVVEGMVDLEASELLATEGHLHATGSLDLLVGLGEIKAEVSRLPLSVFSSTVLGQADNPAAQDWVSRLRIDGALDYSAVAANGAAVVDGDLSWTATGPSGEVLVAMDAQASGGGLDDRGRVDPWQVGLDGSVRCRGDKLDQVLPLIPLSLQQLVADSGLGQEPFALTGDLRYAPREGGRGSFGLQVGTECAQAGSACPITVEVASAQFAARDGVPDWETLEGEAKIRIDDFPGDALRGLMLSDQAFAQRIRRFATGGRGRNGDPSDTDDNRSEDTLDAVLRAAVRQGRLDGQALEGHVVWNGVQSGAAEPEVLAAIDLRSIDSEDSIAQVAVDIDVLPGLDGEHSLVGTVSFPRDLSPQSIRLSGVGSIDALAAPLTLRTAALAGDGERWLANLGRTLGEHAAQTRLTAKAEVKGTFAGSVVQHRGTVLVLPEASVDQTRLAWTGTLDGRVTTLAARLHVTDVSTSAVSEVVAGVLGEQGQLSWFPSVGSLRATTNLRFLPTGIFGELSLDGEYLRIYDRPVDQLSLRLRRGQGSTLTDHQQIDQQTPWQLSQLHVETPGTLTEVEGTILAPSPGRLPEALELQFETHAARYGVDQLVGTASLDGDTLSFRTQRLITKGEAGKARLDVPLGALAAITGFGGLLAPFDIEPSRSPIDIDIFLPNTRIQAVDVEAFEAGPVPAGQDKNFLEATGMALAGSLRLDAPERTELTLLVRSLSGRYSEYEIAGDDQLKVRVAGGRVVLEPFRMRPRSLFSEGDYDQRVVVQGSAELGTFGGEDGFLAAIRELAVSLRGPVDLALLQRFLLPARAKGLAEMDLQLRGPPTALSGRLNINGRDASVDLLEPYVTRFDDLSLAATLDQGVLSVESFGARLNRGRVEASGTISAKRADLVIGLDEVRYRVDYGLSTQLSGDLALNLPLGSAVSLQPDQDGSPVRGRLSGKVRIDRGVAGREIDLDNELRKVLFAPGAASGRPDPLAERVDLDLEVTTGEGVRVRNNVADLRVLWDALRVRGTLAEPVVAGVVDAEPGGILTAYGLVLRVDRGQLRFTGQPGLAPEIELETTSSQQDPSIRRTGRRESDPFSSGFARSGRSLGQAPLSPQSPSQAFTGGLADYLGERVGENLGRTLGGRLSVRPVLVFGETEPSARLILTREIDQNIDLGVSLGLRNAEGRLYLLDVHKLAIAPSLSAQVFTNEGGNQGATVQQNLQLGGGEHTPLQVGKIRFRFDHLNPAARRRLGKASRAKLRFDLSLHTGDQWTDGAVFDAEVDVVESLRESFFPSPEVRVVVTPRGHRRDLLIIVDPGSPANISFKGLRPAKDYRGAIRLSYRSDFFQEASLLEMRKQTQVALEAQGWLGVRVTVNIQSATDQKVHRDMARGAEGDQIVVRSTARGRVTLDRLKIRGLDQEGATAVESALATRGDRVALLLGKEATEGRLLKVLEGLGWMQAQLLKVEASDEGRRLELSFESGRRARIADIRLVGIDESARHAREVQRLAGGSLVIAPGDPVVEAELAGAAIRIEDLLRDHGYSEARVTARAVRFEGEQGGVRDPLVEVRVDAGPLRRVKEVSVDGQGSSSQSWVRRQIEIEPGDLYDRSKIKAGRSRLLATGVFSSVSLEPVPVAGAEAGDGKQDVQPVEDVNLEVLLAEHPRWSLAYGLRFEAEEGLGVVLDANDRNFGGRGLQLGGRALWTDPRKAARLFAGVPRVLGSNVSMDVFLELRRISLDGIDSDVAESTFQLSVPISQRVSGRSYFRYRIDRELDQALGDGERERTRSPIVGAQLVFDSEANNSRGRFGALDIAGTGGPAAALFRGLEGGLGTFGSLDLSTSAGFGGGDFDFVRGFAQIFHSRNAFTLFDRQFTWAQSWRLGVIDNRGRDLPREQRFFAGGEYSVRGYGREALGPQELVEGGLRAIGGEAVFVVNQELRFPLIGDLEGVLLLDSGNVWSTTDALFDQLLTSAGLGVRFRSPVGLLRFDVAFPLDRREQDDSVRFYLGFGHVF